MSNTVTFKSLLDSARETLSYRVQGAIIEFTEQLVKRMGSLGVSKSQLADRMGSSAPYATKLLRGGTNFTLESMVKVADALDADIKIELVPKFSAQRWVIRMDEQNSPCSERLAWTNMQHKRQCLLANSAFLNSKRSPQPFDSDEICTSTGY